MRWTLIIGTLLVALKMFMFSNPVFGQGGLVVSNLEEPTGFFEAVAHNNRVNLDFRTGYNPSGYRLDSLSLLLGEVLGNPNGFAVALYEEIADDQDTIMKLADFTGADPDGAGTATFVAVGDVILSPLTRYAFVVRAESNMDTGAYRLAVSDTGDYAEFDTGWRITGAYSRSSDGLVWERGERQPPQYAIYATPIPTVSINAADDLIELRWEGFEGVTYQVQTRSSLTDSEWTDVGEPLTGDGSELTVPVPVSSGESQSYYRVAILPAAMPSE